jgi:tetratricopeptide (TPR) repeat protein
MIQLNCARLELRRGRPLEAIARLQTVVAAHPGLAAAQASLGFTLRDAGRAAEAIGPLERALALGPDTALYACGLGRALLETGQAERALATAEAHLRRHPGHSGARALEALCRIGIGDEAGALGLLDYPRFVATSTLVTPKGYSSLTDFNAALSEHALNHPSLLSAPLSHATAKGLHSGSCWSNRAARSKPSRPRSARRPARTCVRSVSRARITRCCNTALTRCS